MAIKVKGLEGNELSSGDYVRQPPSRGAWGHAWDVLKGNFFKFILINIFTLIFFVPGIVLMIFSGVTVQVRGATLPLNYMPYPLFLDSPTVLETSVYLANDIMFYSLLLVAGIIASVGLSGAIYSIKRLLATNGEFSIKHFFRGIKTCYFNTLLPVIIFLVFFISCVLIGDWKDLVIASGGSPAGPITAYVFIIIATVLVGIYCGWLLAVGVTYKVKFTQLFKNAFMLMIGTPVQTIFMAGFTLIPVWIYLIGTSVQIFKIIAYALFIFLGFSYIVLCWTAFTQWGFDQYVNPPMKAEAERVRAQKTEKELAQEKYDKEKQAAREMVAAGKSEIIGTPIKPIAESESIKPLGATFTRAQLADADAERKRLSDEVESYKKEHISDPEYVEYNKLFADHERALQENEGKKKSKKKISANNMLGGSKK